MTTWAILASGPSMSQEVADSVRGLQTIAVSDTYNLAPWAAAVVSSDKAWWVTHPEAKRFQGEKYCGLAIDPPEGVVKFPGAISGGNSGLLAIQVAVSKGAERILLLGFDMAGGHYFGDHPAPLRNPTPQRFEVFKKQFAVCQPAGVEIINCTPGSALTCYPFGDAKDFAPEPQPIDLQAEIESAVAEAVASLPKPADGRNGKNGKDGKDGKDGDRGPIGPMPDHQWDGTRLRFEEPDGGWGRFVDLRGPMPVGISAGGGKPSGGGMTPLQALQLQTLLDIFGGWIAEPPVVSIVALVADALEVSGTATAAGFYAAVPSGTPVDAAYEWDWGDGGTSSTLNAVHTYGEAGAYTVSFRARNHTGWSELVSAEITVSDSAELWTPADYEGEKVWYVPADASNVIVGGHLDVLTDLGGGGLDAPAFEGIEVYRGDIASETLNGRAVLTTHPVDDWRGVFRTGPTDLYRNAPGLSIFVVHKSLAPGWSSPIVSLDTGDSFTTKAIFGRESSGASDATGGMFAGGRRLDSDGYVSTGVGADLGTGWMIGGSIHDNANALLGVYNDGTLIASNTSWQTPGLTQDAASAHLSLLHEQTTSTTDAFFIPDGAFAEFVIVRGAVSEADRQRFEGYLAWQWELQDGLPVDHPYKSAAPLK